jgi:hypothetical protein
MVDTEVQDKVSYRKGYFCPFPWRTCSKNLTPREIYSQVQITAWTIACGPWTEWEHSCLLKDWVMSVACGLCPVESLAVSGQPPLNLHSLSLGGPWVKPAASSAWLCLRIPDAERKRKQVALEEMAVLGFAVEQTQDSKQIWSLPVV